MATTHQPASFIIDVSTELSTYDSPGVIEDFELLDPSAKQRLCLRLVSSKELLADTALRIEYQILSAPYSGYDELEADQVRGEEKLRPHTDLGTQPIRCYVPNVHVTDFYSGFTPPRPSMEPSPMHEINLV